MAYATTTHFDQFGLPSATLNALASSTVQDALLSAASGRMDSYLGTRYAVPLTTYGDEVRECACVLAAYAIVQRRGFNPDNAWETALQERRKEALEWLRDIASGKASVPGITESESESWPSQIGALDILSDEARGW